MSTLFNVWHYLVVFVGLLIFVAGIFLALQQQKRGERLFVFFFIAVLAVLATGIGIVAVDKYTKVAKLYRLENKRNLSTEQMSFSGMIKNEGKYEIGEVTLEIKLVNQGTSPYNLGGNSLYNPALFNNFFGLEPEKGDSQEKKPQQVTYTFVVAKNLKPGALEDFRVYVDCPPYFKSVGHFAKVYAH